MWFREDAFFYWPSVSELLFLLIIVKNSYLWYDDSLILLHETLSKLGHTILINKVRYKSIIDLFHVTNMTYLRNNSWKPYAYIVFTTGKPLCHEVLPWALARGKKKPYVYIVFTTGRPLRHEVLPRVLARGKKLT